MAVFDKASLVMIPSQYKEGKIYNIKPENQSSSFEFERGSAATRVNSGGLIEQVGVGDIESVTNSDFNTTDNWVTGSTTSSFTVTNGIATIQGDANSFNTRIGQTLSLEANKSYFIKVRIKSNDGNYWRIRGYDNISGYFDITNGNNTEFNDITYVYNAPSGMNGAPILYISSNFQNGTTDFSVDFASVKEINTDTPRLDYSGTEPALLLEPQRSNLMTYSEQPITNFGFSNTQNITVTQNATTSPDGSTNAMLIESTNSNSKLTVQDIDFVSGTTYTASVYVKNIDATVFNIFFYNASGTPSSTNIDKSSELSSEWTRIYTTYTATANDTGINSQIQFARSLPAGESLYIWGFQIEEGTYPTSYIPTNGQTETRLADVCKGGGDASVFNDSEGTLYVEYEPEKDLQMISLSNGTSAEAVWLYLVNGGTNLSVYVNSGGGQVASINSGTYESITANSGVVKVAATYKNNRFKSFVNGSLIATDTSGLAPTGLNVLEFKYPTGSAYNTKAKIRALYYFPEELTDTELQQLTTI